MKRFLIPLLIVTVLVVVVPSSAQLVQSGGGGGGAMTVGSGGFAAGSFAAGAMPNGASTAQGGTTDAKCTTTDTTACSQVALAKAVYQELITLNSLASTDQCQGAAKSSDRYISVGSTEDEHQIKATAGTLCSIIARNAHASANAFVKCTNLTAANTTPGSSAIVFEFLVQFGQTSGIANIDQPFSTAITCYIVLSKTDAAVDEVAANDVEYTVTYK